MASGKKTSSNVERGKTPQPPQLPSQLEGKVVHGFGRGSKELGCPTANIPIEPYEELLKQLPLGVYYGWASVARGPIYKAAISIGWNPFYKNDKKTIEVHIMHKFESDFYGSLLRVSLQGYIRPEWDFTSLDELKRAIRDDIVFSEQRLDRLDPHIAAFFNKEEHARM